VIFKGGERKRKRKRKRKKEANKTKNNELEERKRIRERAPLLDSADVLGTRLGVSPAFRRRTSSLVERI
jgi:hypothetical protein